MHKGGRVVLLVLPSLALLIFVAIYPFAYTVYLSLTDATLISPTFSFIWFRNYVRTLTDPDFWIYLKNTFIYSFGVTLIEIALGLALALALNIPEVKGKRVLRTLLLLPLMLPPVIGTLMWTTIYEPERGPLNHILALLHLKKIAWLGDPVISLYSVMLIDVYLFTPFAFIILLAGLQGISPDLYEAGRIDGAGRWNTFSGITVPLLRPTLMLVFLIRLALALASFETIYIATRGGPAISTMTLNIKTYTTFYKHYYAGKAASYGMILWIIIFIITNIFIKQTRRK